MACCLVGVRMEKWVVRIAWDTRKHLRWIKVGKAHGLTVTADSYQQIIHIEETRQILKKMYERKICLRLDCHQGLYGTKYVNYQNLQILAKHAELKDTASPTIGQKEVYFGIFRIGKIICCAIILMLCILRRIFLIMYLTQ